MRLHPVSSGFIEINGIEFIIDPKLRLYLYHKRSRSAVFHYPTLHRVYTAVVHYIHAQDCVSQSCPCI